MSERRPRERIVLLHDAVILQHIEHRRVVRRDAVDALRQQVGAQLVGDRFADQPQGILGQPAVRGLRLVQLELLAQEEAQAVEELALQCMLRGGHRLRRGAAELMGDRCLVGLHDQFGLAFQRCEVERGELPAGQRGALPDVLQQLLSARCRQQ